MDDGGFVFLPIFFGDNSLSDTFSKLSFAEQQELWHGLERSITNLLLMIYCGAIIMGILIRLFMHVYKYQTHFKKSARSNKELLLWAACAICVILLISYKGSFIYIHNGLLYSSIGYEPITITVLIVLLTVAAINSYLNNDTTVISSLLICLVCVSWALVSFHHTQCLPTKDIAKPMITTRVKYIGNSQKFTHKGPARNVKRNSYEYATHYNVTTTYHHSMPNARKSGIYRVVKQYRYVYRNAFDKKYLNNEKCDHHNGAMVTNTIGRKHGPYKIDKYYYVPRKIRIIEK